MGLTIENKHSSIDLSYTGFARLRTKIAYLHSKELGKFYDELVMTGGKYIDTIGLDLHTGQVRNNNNNTFISNSIFVFRLFIHFQAMISIRHHLIIRVQHQYSHHLLRNHRQSCCFSFYLTLPHLMIFVHYYFYCCFAVQRCNIVVGNGAEAVV